MEGLLSDSVGVISAKPRKRSTGYRGGGVAHPFPVQQKYIPQMKHEGAPPFAVWAKGRREAVTDPVRLAGSPCLPLGCPTQRGFRCVGRWRLIRWSPGHRFDCFSGPTQARSALEWGTRQWYANPGRSVGPLQSPVIFSSRSGYRAPSTLIFDAAAPMSRRSSCVK
jgi:hypothetical protein